MTLAELAASLDEEFTYPVELQTVLERIGSVRIEAPNATNSETIQTILEPLGTASFNSSEELFETIYGNVSDDYIGRKYYDDRGGIPTDPEMGSTDEENVSF